MKNILLVASSAILFGCTSVSQSTDAQETLPTTTAVVAPVRRVVHPDSSNWRNLFELDLSNAVCEQGVWFINNNGDLTANKDAAIWSDRSYSNFIIDFEYMLDPGANSGCLIYCSNTKDWIPSTVEVQLLDDNAQQWASEKPQNKNAGLYGHLAPKVNNVKPAGEWNHMTVWAVGKRIKVACNGEITVDTDLSQWKDSKKNPDGSDIPPWLSTPWCEIVPKGRIGFQGKHGKASPYFRFIRIKEL